MQKVGIHSYLLPNLLLVKAIMSVGIQHIFLFLNQSQPLKDICFLDTTLKISFKIHFKHDYVFNLLWLYSKEV